MIIIRGWAEKLNLYLRHLLENWNKTSAYKKHNWIQYSSLHQFYVLGFPFRFPFPLQCIKIIIIIPNVDWIIMMNKIGTKYMLSSGPI